ncbi:hypothetical protein M1M25_gp078 [Tenacibaculum phage Gundel_1]|uniref:Uncharacterized protein n=1 Tax=Tenacibaculum phage Gundel_1 TaxID=2745672 RepID=A0A8E4ZGI6_9CAUD|nr:hypothetical protein M1M25_gp078 [Tenacibaculum phage Gundel_1]QQV91514.1 hypothetical protein Gundel1_78 [Tenacibaculum phage Gundel_1]
MSDKLKNIITNVLALIFFGISVCFFLDKDLKFSLIALVVGLSLFAYKVSESKVWLDKLFYKILKK